MAAKPRDRHSRAKDPKKPAASAAPVKLCVAIQPNETSITLGQASQWVVSAWTEGGNVPAATVRLVAEPASLSPQFNFGCGSSDGTASCYLGVMDAKSAERQLQARVTVPVSAATVGSVRLFVIGSAAQLPTDPEAFATVSVSGSPVVSTSPLQVGSLPYLSGANTSPSPTLSPGGNAAGLFPTINPSSQPASSTPGQQKASAKTVANTSALPLGAPVVGAQLIGLGVLALAFVLAVTRLSVRRRPSPVPAAAGAAGNPPQAAGRDGRETDNKPADNKAADGNAEDDEAAKTEQAGEDEDAPPEG